MLTCIYHPTDKYRVVEEDEGNRLIASGFWFDSPVKAKLYRDKVEAEINQESKSEKLKTKTKGKFDER